MCFKLPLNNFRAIENRHLEIHQKKFNQITENKSSIGHYGEESETGYIFTADLEFPEEAQKKLLAFPLVPEAMVIDEDMLSPGQKKTWAHLFKKPYYTSSHKKMVNSFNKKRSYTSHYQLLKFIASLGVKVKLIRGYSFIQKNFISSYVKYCAQQRKMSKNPADKQMWKDLCNIIFGKIRIYY